MFQRDPNFKALNKEMEQKELSDVLGMEAKSILRSIQTEHSKLVQSASLSHSDLHYFRARYNYYRLSLLRLEDSERQTLQKSLNAFRTQIAEAEIGGKSSQKAEKIAPAPFLEEVTQKQNFVEEEVSRELPPQTQREVEELQKPVSEARSSSSSKLEKNVDKESVLSELHLLQIALMAEASNERNAVCAAAVSRLIQKIKEI